ncbi:hypothetical protein PV08_01258 [Exophiala spinifera]|uniref:Uncharacterized protein n=1 Tax=Exophiala spinifera TaxID=91928 RepID=A0A0D1YZE7_9EURO|nr:uncharacterized protein PV08_01258 [Exophiala spinifera]KIW20681.1 hypothetical protein PV08_01258 [Exophiala spinifera]
MDLDRVTPTGNPNYKVYLSDEAIKSLVCRSLPDIQDKHVTVEQLGSGKSFNNRIYYIHLSTPASIARPSWNGGAVDITKNPTREQVTSLVLKISGFPFGGEKIQNELTCLLLLEKYCPSIPAPKLVAWSEDGRRIKTPVDRRGSRERAVSAPSQLKSLTLEDDTTRAREETNGQGWLLMTRTPGRTITQEDLVAHGKVIMDEIAEHVATWRKCLPPTRAAGNMRLIGSSSIPPASATLYDKSILPGLDVYIQGIIMYKDRPQAPLNSYLEYITYILRTNLKMLQANALIGLHRDKLKDIVRQFIKDTLPKLSLLNPEKEKRQTECMAFTHYDISPRNVLVERCGPGTGTGADPPRVSVCAVIDFEFAGFYPSPEEFTHTVENSHSEWAVALFGEFLAGVGRRDALPACIAENVSPEPMDGVVINFGEEEHFPFGGPEFHQAVLLHRIAANIAPWWIKEDSGYTPEALKKELDDAKARIEKAVQILEKMLKEGK